MADDGHSLVTRARQELAVEPRAVARLWLSRSYTLTATAGTDLRDRGDRVFGLDFGMHYIAWDGR